MAARTRPTARGGSLLLLGLALCAAAWLLRESPLLWPGVFLAALPVLSLLGVGVARPRMSVERALRPAELPVGDEVEVQLRLIPRRPGLAATVDLVDRLPRPLGSNHAAALPAGLRGTWTTQYRRRPTRRGRYQLPGPRLRFTDPLGLAVTDVPTDVRTPLVVTPPILPLGDGADRGVGPRGDTAIPHLAFSGPDDVLVREYRPRDDVRRVHWPSTARTGQLMVRREEQSWDPTAWIVLDNRSVHGTSEDELEWLVTVAASVGAALLEAGYQVALTDATGDSGRFGPGAAGRGLTGLLHRLVDAGPASTPRLAAAAREIEGAPSGHLVVAVLGRPSITDAVDLSGVADGGPTICIALHLPVHGEEGAAAVRRLDELGWAVASCPVGSDLAGTWARATAGLQEVGR